MDINQGKEAVEFRVVNGGQFIDGVSKGLDKGLINRDERIVMSMVKSP